MANFEIINSTFHVIVVNRDFFASISSIISRFSTLAEDTRLYTTTKARDSRKVQSPFQL